MTSMDQPMMLTKRERKALKREANLAARTAAVRQRQIEKLIRRLGWSVLGLAFAGGLIWLVNSRPETPASDIIARRGFHWHPELTIYVKGERQLIPANIGLGAVHLPIHTHDDNEQGIVHMEFTGLVTKEDTTLGQFFRNWGKAMPSLGTNLKMMVNGQGSIEYENYAMRDGDKIELHFD